MKVTCKCGCETTFNTTMRVNDGADIVCINCKRVMKLVLLNESTMKKLVKIIMEENNNGK